MLTINCLKCDTNNQLECIDCNLQVDDCACTLQSTEQYVGYLCHNEGCLSVTEVDIEAFLDGDPNCLMAYDDMDDYANYTSFIDVEEEEDDIVLVDFSDPTDWEWQYAADEDDQMWRTKTKVYSKCRHYNQPLEFPDGTVVYPSSHTDREEDEVAPDFGLYLDHCWEPTGIAGFIAWPDYDSPRFPVAAAQSIIDAYKKAQEGLWVEVGCIGGHGRTGTVLACMAVLSGVKASNAVKWIKKNYCSHAVESSIQEWYVEFFDAFVNGGKITEPDRKSYGMKEAIIIPGKKYTFPKSKLDWKSIDILRDNALGHPPKDLLDPAKTLVVHTSKSITKERIQIVKPNSTTGTDDTLPF